ncbi:hypothetical protein Tco_1347146 [Tanacetum coccineum]
MTSRPRTCIPSRPPSGGANRLVIRAKVIENQIMAASAIAISSDSSDESVGSPPSRVILFGDIPTVIPSTSVIASETPVIAHVISSATPVVETTLVTSPTGLCGLVPYSDSDFDSPDEMDSPEVTTRSSLPSDFPIAPVTAPPGTRRRAAILIRPGEAIPLGRPYRTRHNRPQRVMTARKRVRPLPARILAGRCVSPCSSDHRPSSSSSPTDSLLVHSSDLDAPDHAHSGSSTRVVSPRLRYPPRRAPRRSEAFRRWCAAPLSTLSPTDSVPSSTPVTGSLAPTRADLLPPRKRFRDSYSSEASTKEDTEVDPTDTKVDMDLGTSDRDDVRDRVEIDPRDVRDDTSAGDTVKVGIDPRSFEEIPIDLDDVVRNFYHHMSEVCIDRIVEIEID